MNNFFVSHGEPNYFSWMRTALGDFAKFAFAFFSFFYSIFLPASADGISVLRSFVVAMSSPPISIRPNSIVPLQDRGYLVSGSRGEVAWAVKLDANGKRSWEYIKSAETGVSAARVPTYYSATELPDQTLILCGDMTNTPPHYRAALVTHLTHNGVALSSDTIVPTGEVSWGIANLRQSVDFDGGAVLLGYYSDSQRMPGRVRYYYWLVFLDSNGRITRKVDIPSSLSYISQVSQLVVLANDQLAFTGSTSDFEGSEIIVISRTGVVISHKILAGYFTLSSPIQRGGAPVLFGRPSKSALYTATLLSHIGAPLNTSRYGRKISVQSTRIFNAPDGSLFALGYCDNWDGLKGCFQHLGADLSVESSLDFSGTSASDSGSVGAIALTLYQGKFVAARQTFKKSLLGSIESSGIAVDLLDLTAKK